MKRRGVVAGRGVDRVREQPGSGSRPHQQHRCVCGGRQGRARRRSKLTTWNGPGRRAPGVVAGFEVDRLHAGRGAEAAGVLAGQAGGGDAGRQGQLSGGEVGPLACSQPILLARWATELTWSADDRNRISGGSGASRRRQSKRLLTQQGAVMTWDAAGGHTAVLYTNDTQPGRDLCA